MRIGILALAAGRAKRFGSDKRFARVADGRSVLDLFLARALASGLPVMLCLAEQEDELARRISGESVQCVCCRRSSEGMGGTLAEGVSRIRGWDGALVALADMPWVRPDTYRCLAGRLAPGKICVPTIGGERGHPVGFASTYFDELSRLGGDSGARCILARYPGAIEELVVDDPAIRLDIDRPADLDGPSRRGPVERDSDRGDITYVPGA